MTTLYTAAMISNYTAGIRTSADLNPKGVQTLTLELDGAGVPTGYSTGHLIANPNQQIKFPLTTPYTYSVDYKDIKAISGDETSLTITYTDDTVEVIPASTVTHNATVVTHNTETVTHTGA
jgi:hypothetical protein